LRRLLSGVALALAAAVLTAGCGTGGKAAAHADQANGAKLFMGKGQCASCHTLADAGTQGKIGPNLDDAFSGPRAQGFKESTIRNIVHGQILFAISNPSGVIKGPNGQEQRVQGMPQKLVTGQDAQDVAAYVAAVAGVSGASAKPPAKVGNDGKAIFQANCASCHTLKAAGATGTIGPNLDQLKPPLARVKHQVEVGGGVMPAFKGTLTPAQIDAVAKFVSSSAGK
jgi:mono/diheme cytochrome c family protein